MSRTETDKLDLAIEEKVTQFRRKLLRYACGGNRRQFPWREKTRSPYEVLIAEVLLKRTTSTAAAKIYEAFLLRFPDPLVLSRASTEEIAEHFTKVGLQWQRADAAKKLALYLAEVDRGEIPNEMDRLLLIPGVGGYTARSVLSVGMGIACAVVDSNVERILQRVFMRSIPLKSPLSVVQKIADKLLPVAHHREFNLGMLDLGALICRPAFPRCQECPLAKVCDYRLRGVTAAATKSYVERDRVAVSVRRARKKKRLTLVELARKARISKQTVIRIESGKSMPLPETIQKIANALDVSTKTLT